MFSKELKVNCIKGEDIHWATRLVQISNEYPSSLRIKHKEHNMNAKSLLGVLSLKLSNGEFVTITADADIIAITGDMIDSRKTDIDVAISFAQKAVNIAPVYYVNGNHESRVSGEYEKLKQGLTDAGVTILENSSADITIGDETITLIGINDPTFCIEFVDDTMEQNISHQLMSVIPDNDNYTVLLAHRPEYFDVYAGNVDLVLSGHAHGGQFIIPFVGGFVAPGQGFFLEYYEGSHIKDNTEMIVSRGIGNSIIPFRINNKPEIIVAELTKIAD